MLYDFLDLADKVDDFLVVDAFTANIASLSEMQALNNVIGFLVLFLFISLGIILKKSQYMRAQKKVLEAREDDLSSIDGDAERKLQEVEAELAKAKEMVRVKDQFIFIATHELRSTANAILWGFKEFLSREPKMKEKEKMLVDGLTDNSERLLNLINDLARAVSLEGRTMKFTIQEVSLETVLEKVLIEVKPVAEERNVVFHSNIRKAIATVFADPVRLEEVLVNLFTNSIKYSKEKGGTVEVYTEENDGEVMFHVRDDGIGISPEDQEHLFEKFWRAKDVEGREGTGLGLFIVKQMVEFMGGKVWVESNKGEGTTFSFSLKKYVE